MRRPLWPGVLVGVGLAGTLDEVVLHQLLHWHHFYDRSTNAVGLVSDGLFHLFSTAAVVGGIYLLLRGRAAWTPADRRTAIGAALAGGWFGHAEKRPQRVRLAVWRSRFAPGTMLS